MDPLSRLEAAPEAPPVRAGVGRGADSRVVPLLCVERRARSVVHLEPRRARGVCGIL